MESPYRALSPPDPPTRDDRADSDLLPFYFVVWAASVVHVIACLIRRETWGADATFVAILVLGLPSLLRTTIAARFRR